MPTINQLAPVSQLSGGDQIPIYVPNNGDARRTSVTQLTQYVQDSITLSAENVAYAPTFTGAVPTNVEDKLAQNVSVKDFGAVGNGMANDTAAIQAAITAGENGAVYFPPGTYLISTAIIIPSNILIYGAGDSSVIKSNTLAVVSPYPGQNQFVVNAKTNFKIQNLKFDTSAITVFSGGIRCVYMFGCSYYAIQNCTFLTCGAATASLASNNYLIQDNTAIIQSTSGVSQHDGVFDNWNGSSYFKITGNSVTGNSIARYAYLVTGLATDGVTATPCFNFDVSHNFAKDIKFIGFWSQGNAGGNSNFTVSNNNFQNILEFHGIYISESENFVIDSNVIDTVAYNGIRFGSEAGFTTGAKYGAASNNVLIDTNTSTSGGGDGAAFQLTSESSNNFIDGTIVRGSTHSYPIFANVSTFSNYLGDGRFDAGATSDAPFNAGANTNIVLRGTYTPTFTAVTNVTSQVTFGNNWTRSGNTINVTGQISVTSTTTGLTEFRLSLPVASNFTSQYTDCSGSATSFAASNGFIYADTTNDQAFFYVNATGGVATVFGFTFTYLVK